MTGVRHDLHELSSPAAQMPCLPGACKEEASWSGPMVDLKTADRLQQAGRYADAARCYQALLERAPDDVATLHNFGVMHQRCGYPARAAELIARAVRLRPDVAAFH